MNKSRRKNNKNNRSKQRWRRSRQIGRQSQAVSHSIRRNKPLKSHRIRHSEMIGSVRHEGPGEFVKKYEVQPTNELVFPWVSRLAPLFERYIMHNFEVEYCNETSMNTSGSITIAPDYDPTDDNAELTRRKLMSFKDAITGAPFDKFTMRCTKSCLKRNEPFYTRTPGKSPNLRLTDVMNVYVASTGVTTQTYGVLWAHYDIEFLIPQEANAVSSFYGKIDEVSDNDVPFDPINWIGAAVQDTLSVTYPTEDVAVAGREIRIGEPGIYTAIFEVVADGLMSVNNPIAAATRGVLDFAVESSVLNATGLAWVVTMTFKVAQLATDIYWAGIVEGPTISKLAVTISELAQAPV